MRSMQHFPLIGAAIGLWGAVFFNAAAVLFPQAIAAAVSTLATVHITGCFHEDGLADVFDGFGEGNVNPGQDQERLVRVLRHRARQQALTVFTLSGWL